MSSVGINIRALTVKLVALRAHTQTAKMLTHRGRLLEVC
jgi:hypothetical protein